MARVERKRTFSSGGQRPSNALGVFIKIVGDEPDAQGKPAKPKGLLFRLEAPEEVKGQYAVVVPGESYVANARTSQNFPRSAVTALGKDHPAFIPSMLVLKVDDRSKDLKMSDRVSLSYYPGRNQDALYTLTQADKQVRIVHPRTQEVTERLLEDIPESVPVLQVVAYGFRLFSRAAYGAYDPVTGQRVVSKADKVFHGHGYFKVRYSDDRTLYDIALTSQEHPKTWDDLYANMMRGVSDDGMHYNNICYVETPDSELFVYSVPRLSNEERKSISSSDERARVVHERVAKAVEEANAEFEQFKARFPLESLNTWMVRSFCLGTSQNYRDWERKMVRNADVPTNAVEREINFNLPYAEAIRKWEGNRGYIALERPAAWPTMSDEERAKWSKDVRILPHEVVGLKMAVSVSVKEDGSFGFARRFCLTGGEDLVRPYPCLNMTKEAAAAYTLDDYREHLHPENPEGEYGAAEYEGASTGQHRVDETHNGYVDAPPYYEQHEAAPSNYAPPPQDYENAQPYTQHYENAPPQSGYEYPPVPGHGAQAPVQQPGHHAPAAPSGQQVIDIDDDIPF